MDTRYTEQSIYENRNKVNGEIIRMSNARTGYVEVIDASEYEDPNCRYARMYIRDVVNHIEASPKYKGHGEAVLTTLIERVTQKGFDRLVIPDALTSAVKFYDKVFERLKANSKILSYRKTADPLTNSLFIYEVVLNKAPREG